MTAEAHPHQHGRRRRSPNEYALIGRVAYTPLFLDSLGVTGAKQLQAIREGVEDYEYFVLLQKALAAAEARGAPADLPAEGPERMDLSFVPPEAEHMGGDSSGRTGNEGCKVESVRATAPCKCQGAT